jgi:hypothetical protein
MATKARFLTGLLILAGSLLTTTLHAGESGSSDVKAADGLYTVYEIAEWATPVVSFMAQKEASLRDMGAGPTRFCSGPNRLITGIKFSHPIMFRFTCRRRSKRLTARW